MNAKMPALKRCFEGVGFADVKTVLSSGNVVFNARAASEARLERSIETAMAQHLGRSFYTIVRPVEALRDLLEADPYAAFSIPAGAKRIVSFLRAPPAAKVSLPIEVDGARILALRGREVLAVYVPGPRGPVFMRLIEKTFATNITTRTWDTVRKCAAA
jgi:uncharacterized protein (DUF1697 family)